MLSKLPRHWRVEHLGLVACMALALFLALLHSGAASLWHDELVHVYVAKSVAAGEGARLPSGVFYPNAWGYSQILGATIALLGDAEWAVRLPSALFSVVNVLLLFLLARAWFGWRVALLAALLLATSPWHVGWARQARFYELQLTCYLVFILSVWQVLHAQHQRALMGWSLTALCAYVMGMLCSFHSILFLGAPLVLLAAILALHPRVASVWWKLEVPLLITSPTPLLPVALLFLAASVLGMLTALAIYLNPNPVDQQAVFHGIGTELVDPYRMVRDYYVRWLYENMGRGTVLVAGIGLLALIFRGDRQGFFAALAFLVPLFVLTYLIGYRRHRFIFFAYPFFVLALAYGLVFLARCTRWWAGERNLVPLAVLSGALLVRVSWTLLLLLGDSVTTAMGDRFTLAATHPEWRKAGAWVREHRDGHAILSTTYLASLYYVGDTDDWFPNRYLPGEVQESGKPGLGSLEELQDFVAAHPRGYFLSELFRFERWAEHSHLSHEIAPEVTWIRANMRLVEGASTTDVNVYEWGDE